MTDAGKTSSHVPGGNQLFKRIFTRLGCEGRPPDFVVEFHPYAELTLTIRLRGDIAFVRFSDLLQTAPFPVLEAAAGILLARLYRKDAPREHVEIYREFSYDRRTRKKVHAIRRIRGRRVRSGPGGAHHDLRPLFDALNRLYFENSLERPEIGWSARLWRRQLGCFDPALRQIVINRLLDRSDVPEYVVSYVLYHEMLHLKHPMRFARCRLESHSPKFREEEKKFHHYSAAKRFLEKFPLE